MADKRTRMRVTTNGPDYLISRSQSLAQLAIVRVPELLAFDRPNHAGDAFPFDFLVMEDEEARFSVVTRGFATSRAKIETEGIDDLELEVGADLVRQARKHPYPVVMFLFDADRDPGRFLRLDAQPEPPANAKSVLLTFPIENTITGASVRKLASELEQSRLARVG